jgi:hypothetical protein
VGRWADAHALGLLDAFPNANEDRHPIALELGAAFGSPVFAGRSVADGRDRRRQRRAGFRKPKP